MKLGAYDYLAKPFKVDEIKILVKNALEKRDLKRETGSCGKRPVFAKDMAVLSVHRSG